MRRVSARDVHRALTTNVISTGEPSAESTQVLHQLDLHRAYQADPDATLLRLRKAALEREERTDLLCALAELHFHRGERLRRGDGRSHFLGSAFYAFECMERLTRTERDILFDPRFPTAVHLYNRGLTSGLLDDDGEYIDLRPRVLPLPFGELTLEANEEDLAWGSRTMTRFVPVAELEVRGLRNRYRRIGLGAPLAAALTPPDDASADGDHLSRGGRVAATALVFFRGGRQQPEAVAVTGTLRLFTLDDAVTAKVGDRSVPLEYELTAALAFGLAETRLWDFELAAFLSGDFGEFQQPSLQMLSPYDPDRIPVVFVHGTASSPARWAEMLNHLQSDPVLHARYQFWIFRYNTGNPIPFSAGRLRRSLQDLVARLDPEGDDPNLRRMVMIGHSQGGLLSKLCVVESGDAFWRLVSTAPIDTLDLHPETRETLARSLFFSPLPFVERVIFIATPHRGSFLAERRFARLASRFVAMPREVADAASDLFGVDDDRILLRSLDDMPSSIDNMARDNAFGQILVELEVAPGVDSHSIIAILEDHEDIDSGHDGVVSVESARLPGVTSERIVRSGHSTQQHPLTISEVRRILLSGVH